MRRRLALQRALSSMGFVLCLVIGVARGEGGAPAIPKAVITDFSYFDTSGETRDQTAEHAARLKTFNEKIRTDLTEAKAYSLISLRCQGPCPSTDASLQGLVEEARH